MARFTYAGRAKPEELIGETFAQVSNLDDRELLFLRPDRSGFRFYHDQNCCESVDIDEIEGDLEDLVGTPILDAAEVEGDITGAVGEYDESYTWTFYRFTTIKGTVVVRWYGTSNGYYSERVDLCRVEAA